MTSKLLSLSGWPRVIALFACGAGAALSLAPFHFWPLLFVSYGGLFTYLLRVETLKQALKTGWWWGFGFFLVGMYWISISLLVDPTYLWLLPFSLIGLNGGFALFTALSGVLFFTLKRANILINILIFTACLFAGEWLRSHILTGFPWNLIGYAWGANDSSSQLANLFDIYSLTALTIFIAVLPIIAILSAHKLRWIAPIISLLVMVMAYAYGANRLANSEVTYTDISIRIVQPNIDQASKWDQGQAEVIMQRLTSLGVTSTEDRADIIIWPETAIPYTLLESTTSLSSLAPIIPKGSHLISGIVTSNRNRLAPKLWNSLIELDDSATIINRYNKYHLVPFGEYVPLRQWLPIKKLTAGTIDFSAGKPMISTQPARYVPAFLPLICYEIIFPQYVEQVGSAKWIVNITNDDWFGKSSGPYQHLEMARFRAIETGLPVIRAANSGISAVIDPYGRIIDHLGLGEEGVINQRLPNPAENK